MKIIVEFTFDEAEWCDYVGVNPKLVLEDIKLDFDRVGVGAKVISSEGFLTMIKDEQCT